MDRSIQDTRERFLRKTKINHETECWIWTAANDGGRGYGSFRFQGKNIKAHRMSWILFKGEIPQELYVLHKCDTPPCVNPDHLFLGTYKDNSDDKWAKGRGHIQLKRDFCPRGHSMEDAYVSPKGKRMCRSCKNLNYMNCYYNNKNKNQEALSKTKNSWLPTRKSSA